MPEAARPDGGASASAGPPLGILAGSGDLPIAIAEAALRRGRPVHVVAIAGFGSADLDRYSSERVSLGQVGRILRSFARHDVREIVIAGGMARPNLLRLRFDLGFVANLPTVLALTRGGDDSVLRRVVRFFESKGFTVVGVGDVAPELLAPLGQIGATAPLTAGRDAIDRASRLIQALGAFDVGQAAIARPDVVIGVEGVRGTDALLGDFATGGAAAGGARGGVLVKLPKPGQERRVDLPTIGPETVRRAAAAGLTGIAVAAGQSIVMQRAETVAAADAAGIFLLGLGSATAAEEAAVAAPRPPVLEPALTVLSRAAPTPSDRRDVAMGRQLRLVLAEQQAGVAAVISAEHVLAVAAAVPVWASVGALGRRHGWGRRAFRRRLGTLIIDGAHPTGAAALADIELYRTAASAGLAGICRLGTPFPADEQKQAAGWADDAGLFLMGHRLEDVAEGEELSRGSP